MLFLSVIYCTRLLVRLSSSSSLPFFFLVNARTPVQDAYVDKHLVQHKVLRPIIWMLKVRSLLVASSALTPSLSIRRERKIYTRIFMYVSLCLSLPLSLCTYTYMCTQEVLRVQAGGQN